MEMKIKCILDDAVVVLFVEGHRNVLVRGKNKKKYVQIIKRTHAYILHDQ